MDLGLEGRAALVTGAGSGIVLASDRACQITGADHRIDGGLISTI